MSLEQGCELTLSDIFLTIILFVASIGFVDDPSIYRRQYSNQRSSHHGTIQCIAGLITVVVIVRRCVGRCSNECITSYPARNATREVRRVIRQDPYDWHLCRCRCCCIVQLICSPTCRLNYLPFNGIAPVRIGQEDVAAYYSGGGRLHGYCSF